MRHLANSAGALLLPRARYDLVRLGISVYGLSPAPDVVSTEQLGLVPAMTVRGTVVLTKELAAGDGVSYGHTFVAEEPMRVALVPMGYGDGIPRHASYTAEVLVNGVRGRVLGRICMDQFVVGRPRDARRATRSCCSVPGPTASRRPPTGRGGAGRSTTRSSPGWVAGRPASGSGKRSRSEHATLPRLRRRRSRRGRGRRRRDRRRGRAPRRQGPACRGRRRPTGSAHCAPTRSR